MSAAARGRKRARQRNDDDASTLEDVITAHVLPDERVLATDGFVAHTRLEDNLRNWVVDL
jgi:hypothetical protein